MNNLERGADVIRKALKTFPSKPGVYRMLGAQEEVLYVGKAKDLPKRIQAYTRPDKLPHRLQRMIAETHSMVIVTTHTEVEALLLESNLIKSMEPKYNILLRDDKSFPYILLTGDHDFGQIRIHRGKQKQKGKYFGPYASAGMVHQTIVALQRVFQLRNCTDSFFATRKRPCLQYHIKRCSAPCVGHINKKEYAQDMKAAVGFLQGKTQDIQRDLSEKMLDASANTQFEKAAAYRDRIKALTNIQTKQDINVPSFKEVDALAAHQAGGRTCIQTFFFRNGQMLGNRAYFPRHDKDEPATQVMGAFVAQFYQRTTAPKQILLSHNIEDKDLLAEALTQQRGSKVTLTTPKRGDGKNVIQRALKNAEEALEAELTRRKSQNQLLQDVADVFSLDSSPTRIEVYDNSHISGTSAIGVMIVANEEGFDKKSYRKFNIKSEDIEAGDDYAMMREMLTRRFKYLGRKDKHNSMTEAPSLVLVDGGPGQLSVALDVFQELGLMDIPVAGVAKGPDRNAGHETLYFPNEDPVNLPHNHPVLYYIQRLRDESHRFAIGSHRSKRESSMTKSALDSVPGIGGKRKKALLLHFGSVKSIQGAAVEDLMRVEGISKGIAETIYNYFHQN